MPARWNPTPDQPESGCLSLSSSPFTQPDAARVWAVGGEEYDTFNDHYVVTLRMILIACVVTLV
jgi:hypothetical protein